MQICKWDFRNSSTIRSIWHLCNFSPGTAFHQHTLKLRRMKYHLNLSLISSLFKLLVFPITGYLFFKLFNVVGLAFKVSPMILFYIAHLDCFVCSFFAVKQRHGTCIGFHRAFNHIVFFFAVCRFATLGQFSMAVHIKGVFSKQWSKIIKSSLNMTAQQSSMATPEECADDPGRN